MTKRAKKTEAPTISPTGWPLPGSGWTETTLTLCGRSVTEADRAKPYNCWMDHDCNGVVSMFSCACDLCLMRSSHLYSRRNVDRSAEDLGDELGAHWLDVLHTLAAEFGDREIAPQRTLGLDAVMEDLNPAP